MIPPMPSDDELLDVVLVLGWCAVFLEVGFILGVILV
jgi:hypothetical protein